MSFPWIVSIIISVIAVAVYIFHIVEMKKQKNSHQKSLDTLTNQKKDAYLTLFPRIAIDVAAIISELLSTSQDINYQEIVSKLAKTDFIKEFTIYDARGQILASTDLTKCDNTLSDEIIQKYSRYTIPVLVENSSEGKVVKVVSPLKNNLGVILAMDICH
ncbi:MAG: hypothetical protein KAH32_07880 [Chlamydiia bacterium]|nr:hypothetical protein [Chlamydiia bacterium]